MSEALLELPEDPEDGDGLADWAAALMFLEERDSISRGELKRRLAERRGDFAVGLLLEQVRVRNAQAGDAYPFALGGPGMVREAGVDATLYEFLLWAGFTQSPVRQAHDYREIDRFFDRVMLRALRSYLGPRAAGVRFGTPAGDGRPKGFADALKWLADEMDVVPTGSLPRNDHKNDAGADVIIWTPFDDGRADFLVAIAQCTLREEWEEKAAEVFASAALWGGGWISLGRPPITVLGVPFVLSGAAARYRNSAAW